MSSWLSIGKCSKFTEIATEIYFTHVSEIATEIRFETKVNMIPTKTAVVDLVKSALSDIDSREKFSVAFEAAIRKLDYSDNYIATEIQVSRPTIGRWCSGETAPHPTGRESILKYLLHNLRCVGLREIVLEANSLEQYTPVPGGRRQSIATTDGGFRERLEQAILDRFGK